MSEKENSEPFDYDGLDPGYYDLIFHRNKGVQSKWHHLKFRYFLEKIPDDATHLDIGCGPGTLTGNRPNASLSTGIDLASAQIEYATKRYGETGAKFAAFDGSSVPFDDEQFDVVTMVELIEHLDIPTTTKLLNESMRVLKPGGLLLVSTPNYRSGWPLLEKVVNSVAKVTYEEQHITHFYATRLKELLESLHFTEISVVGYQKFAPFLAALSWNLSSTFYNFERYIPFTATGFLLFAECRKPGQ